MGRMAKRMREVRRGEGRGREGGSAQVAGRPSLVGESLRDQEREETEKEGGGGRSQRSDGRENELIDVGGQRRKTGGESGVPTAAGRWRR